MWRVNGTSGAEKKTAQGRRREDTGTEVAVCAERSGKASLLRCTTQTAKKMRERQAGSWKGKEFQPQGRASAKAGSPSMPGCTGLETRHKPSGFPTPDPSLSPLFQSCRLALWPPPILPSHGVTQGSGTETAYRFDTSKIGALIKKTALFSVCKGENASWDMYPATR